MRLTIITPTWTSQPAAVLRAEGTWEQCLTLLSDERLEAPGLWVKLWFEEAMVNIYDDPNDALGAIVQRQEVWIHGVKVTLEFDQPDRV